LVETLPRWLAGAVKPEPQDESIATTTHLVKKDDGRLDWSSPAAEIWRRVRAYTPWPGAMTTHDGVQVQVLQCWPVDSAAGTPGAVFPFKDAMAVPPGLPRPAFAVHTSDGAIAPLVLKKAGKKVLTARDFLNGERGLIGNRLGS
jgi:methionyl-tRNA formyltransferase